MVNYGVSRACETCRKRRKKCDEKRPTCVRCSKAHIACLGYRGDEVQFRHYAPPQRTTPGRSPALENTLDDQFIKKHAVDIFLDDYVASPTDPALSRGFLDGLSSLLTNADPGSDLVQAAQLVACASIGNRQNQPRLLEEARQKYVTLLGSFHLSLSRATHATSIEALITAVLLGLYEIVSSSENDPGQHVAHVRGVCAILLENASPFDLSASTHLFQVANPLIMRQPRQLNRNPGVLCAPGSHKTVQNLDSILIQCHPLFERANKQLQNPALPRKDLEHTFEYALAVEASFARWIANLLDPWKATIVGTIDQSDVAIFLCPYFWSGPIHMYLDVYVAAVMNTYRKTRLMLLEVLGQMAWKLNRTEAVPLWERQSGALIDDILASIPYHLANDPKQYIDAITSGTMPLMGRPVGGLLLLHPLYVLASCSIVPAPIKDYVRQCLAWIGQHMGIGQATLIAKGIENMPFQQMAEGHVLIWAGMLLQPSHDPNGRLQ